MIDEAIALVDQNGDLFMMPELLRIKATILMMSPDRDSRYRGLPVGILGNR